MPLSLRAAQFPSQAKSVMEKTQWIERLQTKGKDNSAGRDLLTVLEILRCHSTPAPLSIMAHGCVKEREIAE